jgi:type II secretory pathway pseudopilin PulG
MVIDPVKGVTLRPQPSRRARGFTLLEITLVLLTVAVLVALSVPAYSIYAQRAQLAQLLLQIDQISTAVQIEDATGMKGLHREAQPGKSPPGLGVVPDASFNEPGGIRLLLIQAPAGFFPSSPKDVRYGLIADLTGSADVGRLAQLRHALPFDAPDKIWIADGQLAFPLVARSTYTAVTPPTLPATSWEGAGVPGRKNTWSAQATLSAYGTDGKPLTGVNAGMRIKVTLSVTTWDGRQIERSWTDLGNLNAGKTSFSIDGLAAQTGKGEVVTSCRLEVTGIDYYWPKDPPIKWDGQLASIQMPMPR